MSAHPAQQLRLFDAEPPCAPGPRVPLHRLASCHPPNPLFRFCNLGSGSGGNASVVQFANDALLIDAGFGPRTIADRLKQIDLSLDHLRGILLTHLDQDHFRPHWVRTLLARRIPVYLHRWHLPDLKRTPEGVDLQMAGLIVPFDAEPFAPLGEAAGFIADPVRLPHDTKGTVGFVLHTACGRIGYATDLGHVPAELIQRFTCDGGVDLLAIECNYDPPMQERSSRPQFLKRRIMGGHGHLSNEEAFAAVQRIAQASARGCPQRIVLLHRSAQCNCPTIVRRVFEQDQPLSQRTVLTEQRRRSPVFEIRPLATIRAAQAVLAFTA